eukprot:SM000258S09090  [mRNA]  locus=s258:4684:6491:+ [translate_table: standard]
MTASVKVTNLSAKVTEKDLWEFFAFSGEIRSIELTSNDVAESKSAYVTFQDERALDTALLLTGAILINKPLEVVAAEGYVPPPSNDFSSPQVPAPDGLAQQTIPPMVDRAQNIVTDMLAKGYILGKDAMTRAKDFDDRHQLTKTASTKAAAVSSTAASLDKRMGFSQKISAGAAQVNQSVKAVDEKYHVSETTRSVTSAAEQRLNEAGAALMKNKYVALSTEWLSGAYGRITKAIGDVSMKTREKVQQKESGLSAESGESAQVPDTAEVGSIVDHSAASEQAGSAAPLQTLPGDALGADLSVKEEPAFT